MKPLPSCRRAVGLAVWSGLVLIGMDANAQEQPPETAPGEIVRYAPLSSGQKSALRRQFVLPLDALFRVQSKQELAASVVVSPLPDPSKPLLNSTRGAADQSGAKGNPFAPAGGANPLGPLGELFQLERSAESSPAVTAGESAPGAPAAITQSDPFADSEPAPAAAAPSVPVAAPAAADEGDFDDPFADF